VTIKAPVFRSDVGCWCFVVVKTVIESCNNNKTIKSEGGVGDDRGNPYG
jgi:hypothetical protein